MDLQYFNRLKLKQREEAVWENGTFILIRVSSGFWIDLYYTGKFFVEVIYWAADNQVILVRGLKGHADLYPYLEVVNIGDLMN